MDENFSSRRFHRVMLAQGAAILIVFALLAGSSLLLFRFEIRNQILSRDGTFLTSLAQHLYDKATNSDRVLALLDVALESSEMKDVIGVSLYSATGEPMASIPPDISAEALPAGILDQLAKSKPRIQYYPAIQLSALFSDVDAIIDDNTYPVTGVTSPIFDANGQLVAAIQYLLDSEGVAGELGHLDTFLMLIGLVFLAGGGIIFTLVFWISRNRILKMGVLLAEQNRSLKKANADLSMAARTSAIGSISSHLFHGLKNPLSGLKAYLQVTGHDEEVLEITTRMQALIDDSLAVIREEEDALSQTLSHEEFKQVTSKRLLANKTGNIRIDYAGEASVPSHKAQLLLLVLGNLVDNATEATRESPVKVSFEFNHSSLTATVSDSGPGLPEHVKANLFQPVTSTKENGTGIGLAISAVIAQHIPAELILDNSDSNGTRFRICMPL